MAHEEEGDGLGSACLRVTNRTQRELERWWTAVHPIVLSRFHLASDDFVVLRAHSGKRVVVRVLGNPALKEDEIAVYSYALLHMEAAQGDALHLSGLSTKLLSVDSVARTVHIWREPQNQTSGHASLISNPNSVIAAFKEEFRHRFVASGMKFPIAFGMKQYLFSVALVKGSCDSDVYLVTDDTNVKMAPPKKPATTQQLLSVDEIGGLNTQVQEIREILELPQKHPDIFTKLDVKPPNGVLLVGPPGTGKTLIAKTLAKQSEMRFFQLSSTDIVSKYFGESEANLKKVFVEASEAAPSIVFVDEIDAIAPKREQMGGDHDNRVVATLLSLLDNINDTAVDPSQRVFVLAATNRPDSLDPALRRPGRFDRELEIGIPDQHGRADILRVQLRKMTHSLSDADVCELCSVLHGYVGADIAMLCKESGLKALTRCEAAGRSQELKVTLEDFKGALSEVRPSAMREVMIEVPSVKWTDIGGQESTKQRLKEAVEWPLKHPDAFRRMGIRPPKGILLYGPPGCSKTLMAKALATEGGVNFLAVKGPELFSKWVGESERAVREVFRKARNAAPAVIFFDEIDALAASRESGGDSGGVHDRVLSQLLHEMDGVESLKDVTIVAATNRPDMIDPALLRPGRIDRILYISPPDLDSRTEIFSIALRKMPHEDEVQARMLAEVTDGYSGAEIAAICREAGLAAMREDMNTKCVARRHFDHAITRVDRRITPDMIAFYDAYRQKSTVESI